MHITVLLTLQTDKKVDYYILLVWGCGK